MRQEKHSKKRRYSGSSFSSNSSSTDDATTAKRLEHQVSTFEKWKQGTQRYSGLLRTGQKGAVKKS